MRGKILSERRWIQEYQLGAFILSDLTFRKVVKWKNQKYRELKERK